MRRFTRVLGAVGLVACLISGASPARADATFDRMLGWAPAPAEPVWAGPIVFGYSRADLLFAAAGGGEAQDATELLAVTRFTAPSLMTILAYPPGFFQTLRSAERWPEKLGFDVTAVDAILTTGMPPDMIEIYGGPPAALTDLAALAGALEPRGFARKDIAGVPVWARFRDGSISMADIDRDDPFGGMLGQSARISAEDGILVRTVRSAPLAAAIAASQGGPSLAAEPAVKALVASFGDETIVQVTMFGPQAGDPAAVLLAPDADPAAIAEQLAQAGREGLPGYYLAALADLAQPDGSWRTVLALAFPDPASATAAAPMLVERAKATLPAALFNAIDARVVDTGMPGFAVVRMDITPAPEQSPLRRLFQMLMRRDNAIWAIGPVAP